MTNSARMWPYWRDDKGVLPALDDYYSELIKTNERIMFAKLQIEGGIVALNREFERLAALEPDDDH